MTTHGIRILGIDPGLRRTGWGIIDMRGNDLGYVACGTVLPEESALLPERLRQLHAGLTEIVALHEPDEAAVEQTFVNRDATATLKLGHARGVALLVPAQARIPVAEYAPNLVKKTVVGTGHGEKRQIRAMIAVLLPKAKPGSDDAADALAVAIAHARPVAPARRGGLALDRDRGARGPDPALRLRHARGARMVPHPHDRAGRRQQGRARAPLGHAPGRTRRRHRAPGQRAPGPRPGRRPEARPAHRLGRRLGPGQARLRPNPGEGRRLGRLEAGRRRARGRDADPPRAARI